MKYAAAALSVATILSVAHAVIRDDDPAATIVDSEGRALSDRSLRGNPFEEDNGMATYIVTFADDSGDRGNKAAALAKANGGSVGSVFKRVLNGAAMTLPKAAANGLKNNPKVASVDEDQLMYATASAAKYTWGQDRIDQCNSGASNGGGTFERQDASNVKIYVLDTGVYAPHSDFTTSNLINSADSCNRSYTKGQDQSMSDKNGHGTHVASTICGEKYGAVTCGAGMLCGVQVLSSSGSGSTSGIIAAIDDAAMDCETFVNSGGKGCVANMSLGGGRYDPLDAAVDAAVAAGLTMVVAAGNDNSDACSYSPARAMDAITVGATDSSDKLASFTNTGSCVDVFAPGVGTIAASAQTTDGTRTYSGTSMASPHAAALAAAEIEKGADTPADVVAALEAGVTMMNVDCNTPGTGIATNDMGAAADCSTTTNSCGPTGSPPTGSPPTPPPPTPPSCGRAAGETCMKNNCQNWSGCAGQGSSCCCCSGMECGGSGRTGTCRAP